MLRNSRLLVFRSARFSEKSKTGLGDSVSADGVSDAAGRVDAVVSGAGEPVKKFLIFWNHDVSV